MTSKASPPTAFLEALREHGWACKHPDKSNTVAGLDGRMRRVVVIEGNLWGVQQMAYLCRETGFVMMMGTEHDLEFAKFVEWLKLPCEPKPEPVKRNVLQGQKSLFGDD